MGNQQPKEILMQKITQERFEEKVATRFPEERFTIISYSSQGKPLKIRCDNCGKIINVKVAGNFLAKNKAYGCVNCHGLWKEREKTWQEINKRYFVEYVGIKDTHKRYNLTCRDCGHVRYNLPLTLIKSHLECGCKTNNIHRTKEELEKELSGNYELLSDFNGMLNKVTLKCKTCGFIWKVRPSDVIYGKASCPHCQRYRTESKGEKIIRDILEDLNIPFEQEHMLTGSFQRFDFFIPDEKTPVAIEYQGIQHYRYIKYFHKNAQGFKDAKRRDELKKEYCRKNGIILFEIPYSWKESTIKEFLHKNLSRFNDHPEKE